MLASPPMRVELLTIPGCTSGERTAALLSDVLGRLAPGTPVARLVVATAEEAIRLAFPGSPTVRLDGRDIEPDPPASVGLG